MFHKKYNSLLKCAIFKNCVVPLYMIEALMSRKRLEPPCLNHVDLKYCNNIFVDELIEVTLFVVNKLHCNQLLDRLLSKATDFGY